MVGDLGKSINGYIENCVMFDLDLPDGDHEVTRETLEKSTDLWECYVLLYLIPREDFSLQVIQGFWLSILFPSAGQIGYVKDWHSSVIVGSFSNPTTQKEASLCTELSHQLTLFNNISIH